MVGGNNLILNCLSSLAHGRTEHKILNKNDFKQGWNKTLQVILEMKEFYSEALNMDLIPEPYYILLVVLFTINKKMESLWFNCLNILDPAGSRSIFQKLMNKNPITHAFPSISTEFIYLSTWGPHLVLGWPFFVSFISELSHNLYKMELYCKDILRELRNPPPPLFKSD